MNVGVVFIYVPRADFVARAQTFFQSFLAHTPGCDYEMTVAVKSSDTRIGIASLPPDFSSMYVGEGGWDVGVWVEYARRNPAFDRVVLLGGYSEILCDDWLLKLTTAGELTSATGSHEILPHLRTNCISAHPALLSPWFGQPFETKPECFAFEHGSDSLYRYSKRNGTEGYVVASDGSSYEEESWQEAGTYRTLDQPRLMCHDRHTRIYQTAGPEERRNLEGCAWPYSKGLR